MTTETEALLREARGVMARIDAHLASLSATPKAGPDDLLEQAAALVSDGQPIGGIQTIIVGREYARRIRALDASTPKAGGEGEVEAWTEVLSALADAAQVVRHEDADHAEEIDAVIAKHYLRGAPRPATPTTNAGGSDAE